VFAHKSSPNTSVLPANQSSTRFLCTAPSLRHSVLTLLRSCSLDCYKTHKSTHADTSKSSNNTYLSVMPSLKSVDPSGGISTPNGVSRARHSVGDQFHTLPSSPKFQQLLNRHPRLRSQLHHIYVATLEPAHESQYRSDHHHHIGRGRGRGRGRGTGRGAGQSPWTQESGFNNGLHRLTNTRDYKGTESGGIEEFSKLALELSPVVALGSEEKTPLPPTELNVFAAAPGNS